MIKRVQTTHAERALRERVKELSCLYGIARIAARPIISLDEALQEVVGLLPAAWQYPTIACARITLDEHAYATANAGSGPYTQSADIVVAGARRGTVAVTYLEERPLLDEGPFMKEERNLLDAVAGHIALILERKQAEQEKAELQAQLMRADRLATVGILAAGVAHELNEPLGNILGFAELTKRTPELSNGTRADMEKIESACLHAKEVIRKLLTFARELPPQKARVNLNTVIAEGLYFFEARCAKTGVKLVRSFDPGLPDIVADPAQLNQVLVNLITNALYEMPQGGVLRVKTGSQDNIVHLVVQDTGTGIAPDMISRVFDPFFTTKDIGKGTGLGLAVVHGIVTSHGGDVSVSSKPGKGAVFRIDLPAVGDE
jgi:two-component system NtrC family sensor kinase